MSWPFKTLLVQIDMVLHCPNCGMQHIDAPEEAPTRTFSCQHAYSTTCGACDPSGRARELWNNPPHRSHLCHGCGHIWRPADVPTNGVAAVKTKGKDDSPLAQAGWKLAEIERLRERVFELEADPKSGDVIPLAEPRQGALRKRSV